MTVETRTDIKELLLHDLAWRDFSNKEGRISAIIL